MWTIAGGILLSVLALYLIVGAAEAIHDTFFFD